MKDVEQETAPTSGRARPPLEIRVSAALIGGIGVAFALVALLRLLGAASAASTVTPLVSAVFGVLVAVGLLAGKPAARVAGLAVLVLFAMLHALITLSDGPWWVRVFSGLATAGYLYAGVLLNTRPARDHLTGVSA